jgi:hypothetical protein
LPRGAEAVGVREKLARYSLAMGHESGGPKAYLFKQLLGMGGMVVNTWRDEVMVEIVEHPSGYTLDVIDVPVDCVKVAFRQGVRAAV